MLQRSNPHFFHYCFRPTEHFWHPCSVAVPVSCSSPLCRIQTNFVRFPVHYYVPLLALCWLQLTYIGVWRCENISPQVSQKWRFSLWYWWRGLFSRWYAAPEQRDNLHSILTCIDSSFDAVIITIASSPFYHRNTITRFITILFIVVLPLSSWRWPLLLPLASFTIVII